MLIKTTRPVEPEYGLKVAENLLVPKLWRLKVETLKSEHGVYAGEPKGVMVRIGVCETVLLLWLRGHEETCEG